ncbi:MAG: glycosyltransferase [Verrucomicrobiota bacterium]
MSEAPHVTHLTTTVEDGAGIAAVRQHLSLHDAGATSRLLCSRGPAETIPQCARDTEPLRPFSRRLRDRLPFAADAATTLQQAYTDTVARARADEQFEFFSLPYSRWMPEGHPWVGAAAVVHLHWISGFIDYPRFFAAVRQPLVWTLHDQQPYLGGFHYETDRASAPSLRALDDTCRTLKQAALARSSSPLTVLGNSQWNTTAAQASGFFPEQTRFETVYYPLDTTRYSPRDKRAAKLTLGLAADDLIIGFASTSLDNPRKGFRDLLAAIAHLENAGQRFTLLSFGRTPDRDVVASVRSRWQHLGFLQEDILKSAAYSAMDIFVIPSHAESFGQTAIEAMACGTAVIGANVGGIAEALDSGRCGRLFPSGNVASLAGEIQALANAPAERAELAAKGRQHVIARHSPPACAARLVEIYRDLVRR